MRQLESDSHHWYLEQQRLDALAERFGTPLYVYSSAAITAAWQEWTQALTALGDTATRQARRDHRASLSFAVKANSNLSVLSLLNQLGAGFDVVSGGELQRVLAAGGLPEQIVFSGVGKSKTELALACEHRIACINLESVFEYRMLCEVVDTLAPSANEPIDVALRLNPDVDAGTHAYITTGTKSTKFGLQTEEVLELAEGIQAHPLLRFAGLVSHIGSQIFEATAYAQTLSNLLDMAGQLLDRQIQTPTLGLGGGWGVAYAPNQTRPPVSELIQALQQVLTTHPVARSLPELMLAFEPGRSIVAEAGVLLTRVVGIKDRPDKNFAIVDAAMNDYIRPALYQASNQVVNLSAPKPSKVVSLQHYDLVGPVCESGDFLALDCPIDLAEGDVVAVLDTGAYGFSMSSNYNTRPRPAEVLVDGAHTRIIRHRESMTDLLASESDCLSK